jgi:mannose-6-phosphate isomerase-like protein (cupin superfamily)
MAVMVAKSIDNADEVRKFPAHGWLDLVTLPGVTFARATFQPGWRWSNDIAPVAGTKSCQVHHNGYVVSGRMHIVMDDGAETDVGPGDVFVCAPGHDAWTLGDEDCVVFDFSSDIAKYAKA